MATVSFLIKGNKNPSTILVRFINGRDVDFKRSTNLQVNPKNWNNKEGKVRRVSTNENLESLNEKLQELRTHILKSFNSDFAKGVIINSEWLKALILNFNGQFEKTDLNLLVNYTKYFIANLPTKVNHSKETKVGVSARTIEKYENILSKIQKFEKQKKVQLNVSDVNLKFAKDFTKFLKEVETLSDNTIGRVLPFVKTICRDAELNGIKVSNQLNGIKGYKLKVSFVYLNEEEIEQIIKHDFRHSPYLDNARDWLIIGLFTGQRVSDFMSFTKKTISEHGYLEFKQQKTNALTVIPIHEEIEKVLKKHKGKFPRKISEPNFNKYIKTVCREVGLTELVEGRKINSDTNRKEEGMFPKCDLVTSHICRRSFATNHYGKLPTPVLMSMTNHSTEKSFLTYIGKTSADHALIMKQYWDNLKQTKETGKANLEVSKSA